MDILGKPLFYPPYTPIKPVLLAPKTELLDVYLETMKTPQYSNPYTQPCGHTQGGGSKHPWSPWMDPDLLRDGRSPWLQDAFSLL